MTYFIKTHDGKILKGKAESWKEVERSMPYGGRLYNPHNGRTIIGWNAYKADMAREQKKRYGR